MNTELYHVIIYVPKSHADDMRAAIARAGAGSIGNYNECSFSSEGTGRFLPNDEANPTVGTSNEAQEVPEEKIETVVQNNNIKEVLQAAKKNHPYEEPAIHVIPMMDYKKIL